MPSNLPDPDKIPDMSLDDHSIKADRPRQPPDVSTSYQPIEVSDTSRPAPVPQREPEPPPPAWREGDYVLSPWEPMFLYPGVIKHITIDDAKGDQAVIDFDDGGEGSVFIYSLSPFKIERGEQVQVRRYNGPNYVPAEVLEISDDDVHVRFDEGGSEWTTTTALRIPCVENGPGAVPIRFAVWQTPPASSGSGIPSWVIWIGITLLLAFFRIACREMGRN